MSPESTGVETRLSLYRRPATEPGLEFQTSHPGLSLVGEGRVRGQGWRVWPRCVTGGKGGVVCWGLEAGKRFPRSAFLPPRIPKLNGSASGVPVTIGDAKMMAPGCSQALLSTHPPTSLGQVPSVPGRQSPLTPWSLACSPPLSSLLLSAGGAFSLLISAKLGASGAPLILPPLERESFLSGSLGILGTETELIPDVPDWLCPWPVGSEAGLFLWCLNPYAEHAGTWGTCGEGLGECTTLNRAGGHCGGWGGKQGLLSLGDC